MFVLIDLLKLIFYCVPYQRCGSGPGILRLWTLGIRDGKINEDPDPG
jgi:hypothetical protein